LNSPLSVVDIVLGRVVDVISLSWQLILVVIRFGISLLLLMMMILLMLLSNLITLCRLPVVFAIIVIYLKI
jgi:hypothetical protein